MTKRVKIGDVTAPLRGLWLCKTTHPPTKETAAYKWIKTGRMPAPIEGCLNWNVYIGRKPYVVGSLVVLDAICKRCNRRVKFQHSRLDSRGKVSPARFLGRPSHMPKQALIEEMLARNRRQALDTEIEGFQKASDLNRGGV